VPRSLKPRYGAAEGLLHRVVARHLGMEGGCWRKLAPHCYAQHLVITFAIGTSARRVLHAPLPLVAYLRRASHPAAATMPRYRRGCRRAPPLDALRASAVHTSYRLPLTVFAAPRHPRYTRVMRAQRRDAARISAFPHMPHAAAAHKHACSHIVCCTRCAYLNIIGDLYAKSPVRDSAAPPARTRVGIGPVRIFRTTSACLAPGDLIIFVPRYLSRVLLAVLPFARTLSVHDAHGRLAISRHCHSPYLPPFAPPFLRCAVPLCRGRYGRYRRAA